MMNPRVPPVAQSNPEFEPWLSPTFAERVIREADRIREGRRLRRRIGGAVAGLLVAAGAALFLAGPAIHNGNNAAEVRQAYAPTADWEEAGVVAVGNIETAQYDAPQTAAGYFFPDAQSVINFSNEFANDPAGDAEYALWSP